MHLHAGCLPQQQAQQDARQQQQARLIMADMLAKLLIQVKWSAGAKDCEGSR